MRGQAGTPCRLTYDSAAEVAAGDVVVSSGGSCYLVTAARRMRSRHPDRWALDCLRIAAPPAEAHIHRLWWYPRRRRAFHVER